MMTVHLQDGGDFHLDLAECSQSDQEGLLAGLMTMFTGKECTVTLQHRGTEINNGTCTSQRFRLIYNKSGHLRGIRMIDRFFQIPFSPRHRPNRTMVTMNHAM